MISFLPSLRGNRSSKTSKSPLLKALHSTCRAFARDRARAEEWNGDGDCVPERLKGPASGPWPVRGFRCGHSPREMLGA